MRRSLSKRLAVSFVRHLASTRVSVVGRASGKMAEFSGMDRLAKGGAARAPFCELQGSWMQQGEDGKVWICAVVESAGSNGQRGPSSAVLVALMVRAVRHGARAQLPYLPDHLLSPPRAGGRRACNLFA